MRLKVRSRISIKVSLLSNPGIISTVDGIYRNPATEDTLSLDEAVKYGLISGEILDTKRKTEEKILDSTNIVARSMDEPDSTDGKQSHESSLHVSYEGFKVYCFFC